MYTNQVRSEFRYLCGWFPAEKKKTCRLRTYFVRARVRNLIRVTNRYGTAGLPRRNGGRSRVSGNSFELCRIRSSDKRRGRILFADVGRSSRRNKSN